MTAIAKSSRKGPRPPLLPGRRSVSLLGLFLAGLIAAWALGLNSRVFVPSDAGLAIARRFLASAMQPALDYQASFIPPDAPPFLLRLSGAVLRTLAFAAAAMSLALPIGFALGFLASSTGLRAGSESGGPWGSSALRSLTRLAIALMRSVHELLWAVLLLASMGLNTMAGVVALAIPFAGTLAKVFSEMLDEAPRNAAHALRTAGAPAAHVFLFGQLPRALPDLAAYAFYRFECAVRSSAVLGFFGFPTLGYYLRASFDNHHYGEVWTYLYAMGLVVVALEVWSGRLRAEKVA